MSRRPPPRPLSPSIALALAAIELSPQVFADFVTIRNLADGEIRTRAELMDIVEAVKGGERRAIFDQVVRARRRADAAITGWARSIPWATEHRVLQDVSAYLALVRTKAIEARAGVIDLVARRCAGGRQ